MIEGIVISIWVIIASVIGVKSVKESKREELKTFMTSNKGDKVVIKEIKFKEGQ